MADDISKTSKQTVEAIDRIANKLEDFYKKANKTNYFKSISKLSEEIDSLSSNFTDLEKSFDKLGISSEASLGGILKTTDELQKKFRNLADTKKGFANLQNTMSGVKKSLSLVNKTMNVKELKEFKNILNSMGDNLSIKEFGELNKSINDAFDGKNVGDFQNDLKKLSKVGFKSVQKNLKDLKKDEDIFGGLSEDTQGFVNKLLKVNPKNLDAKQIEEYAKGFEKLGIEVDKVSAKKIEELSKDVIEANKKTEESNKKRYSIKQHEDYFKSIADRIDDLDNHVNQQKLGLGLDINPEDKKAYDEFRVIKEKHEAQILKLLDEKLAINKEDTGAIEANAAAIEKEKKSLQDVVEEKEKQLNFQEKYNNALQSAPLNKYANSWKSIEDKSINASAQIKNIADMTSQKYPALSNMIGKVSDKFKLVGENAAKFKFGAGLITGAFTLLKAITEIEKKAAPVFRDINSSGLLLGKTTGDIGSSMLDLGTETNNMGGLLAAAFKVPGSFALGQEEILGTVSALDKAGLASKNLKNQMKPIMSTISGTSSELAAAATMVKTFSGNLGIADVEVANLMGNMAFEFNSTMGSLQENFTGITSAIQNSSMSSTRFLGILATSTAGMSIYAEQVEGTAKAIARLDKNTNLSQKGIENFAKGAAEAAKNSNQMATSMAVFLKGDALKSTQKNLKKSMEDIYLKMEPLKSKMDQGKASKEEENLYYQLEGQSANTKKMADALERKDFFNAAQFADKIGADENIKMQTSMFQELVKLGKMQGNNEVPFLKEIAKGTGMEGILEQYLALGEQGQKKLLEGLDRGDPAAAAEFKKLQEAESDRQKYTGEGLGKLIEGVIGTSNVWLGMITGILTVIAAGLAIKGGFTSIKNIKDIFSKGGGNYKGGGGSGGGRSIGLANNVATSAGKKGLGGIIDSSKNFLGNIGKSVGGSFLGKAGKVALKRLPLIGALLGGGMAYAGAKSEGDSESKAKGKGIGSTAGALIGGAVGMLGGPLGAIAGAYIGEMAGEALGGFIGDSLDDSKKLIPQAPQTLTPSSHTSKHLGAGEVAQANKELMKNASNYVEKMENHFVYNIKGEDEQRIKRLVGEGIQNSIKAIREGSGKS